METFRHFNNSINFATVKNKFNFKFNFKMKKTIKTVTLFAALISLMSCGESSKPVGEMPADSVKVVANMDSDDNAPLYNIPSPIETFTIFKASGASFDKSFLNPVKNLSKYTSNFSKAINLGTYSADLSFCLLYKQTDEVNFYLKNISELTASLGIIDGFVQSVTKRLKDNTNNSDSMMQIVSEASVNANLYLKENQRNNTTALITAGGWVEGMHFITNMAVKTKKKEIIGLVAQQKNVLKNLSKMLEKLKSDTETAGLLADIKDIASVYENMKSTDENAVASADKNIKSIGNNKSYNLSDEQLNLILTKVEALRNKLTN